MPGSIRVTVLDALEIVEAAGQDGVAVRASMGKKQYTTSVEAPEQGKVGPWDAEYSFAVLSLTDNLSLALLSPSGEVLGTTQVTTPSIVEKGFRDEFLSLKDTQGNAVAQVHVKLSFVLSDEERKKIELMRAKSLAKKAGTSATPSLESSSSLNGGRSSSASRFSFEKALENGGSNGSAEAEAAVAAVSQEVAAQVAQASTAAFQATAEVAQQAAQAARDAPAEVAGRASKTAQKAAEVSEKAAGVAATAAKQAGAPTQNGGGRGHWDEDEEGEPAVQKAGLERQQSVKQRVAAMESPDSSTRPPVQATLQGEEAPPEVYSQKKGVERRAAAARSAAEKELARAGSGGRSQVGSAGGDRQRAQEEAAQEAAQAEEDWQRAEAAEAALVQEEERKRAEAAHLSGKAAEQARRYEAEYRQQRQQEEEHKRRKAEKKQEQERRRVAAATRAEAEQQQMERKGEEEDAQEEAAGHRRTWQQVASTLAFGVALFLLWPRNTRQGFASRRRVKVSGGQYVVRKGDTLENIVGRMCYVKDSDFYKLNPDVCDRNTIFPGQVIHVPEYM